MVITNLDLHVLKVHHLERIVCIHLQKECTYAILAIQVVKIAQVTAKMIVEVACQDITFTKISAIPHVLLFYL